MSANGAHRSLADHTTLRAGGPARELVFVESREHAVEVARRADRAGRPLLVLGGGSNALVGDGGFDGTVARKAARGLRIVEHTDDAVVVAAEAGGPWGALVEMSVAEGSRWPRTSRPGCTTCSGSSWHRSPPWSVSTCHGPRRRDGGAETEPH